LLKTSFSSSYSIGLLDSLIISWDIF